MLHYDSDMQDLFEQLGLDNDTQSIDEFIERNKIYGFDVHITDAPCWDGSQATFIRDSLYYDNQLAEAVDQLDIMLRN
ncbi:MAG: DUF2789 domain-containing protein [Amphritea sp.]|nr:DUF2789 domain-containing protein [Amphritea sp.]